MVLQVISYSKIFEVGSPHPILGKITTLPVTRITKGPRSGSFRAKHSRNGNRPGLILFYGFMGSVSSSQNSYSFVNANGFPFFAAGAGKSVLWYANT
jgi:hypothetical protein